MPACLHASTPPRLHASMPPCLHPPAPCCHGWMDLRDGWTRWMPPCTPSFSCLDARPPSHASMHALDLVMLHLASLLHGSLAMSDVGCWKELWALGSAPSCCNVLQPPLHSSFSLLTLECVSVRRVWAHVPVAAGARHACDACRPMSGVMGVGRIDMRHA